MWSWKYAVEGDETRLEVRRDRPADIGEAIFLPDGREFAVVWCSEHRDDHGYFTIKAARKVKAS